MFGMKKTSEADRLRAVYADQSDGELLRLHEERDGLTDVAQQALAEIIKQRALGGGGNTAEGSRAARLTQARETFPREELAEDLMLWLCRDPYQLRNLVPLLEEADIAFRLEEYSQSVGTGVPQQDTGVKVFVEPSREREARALLRGVLFTSGLDQEEPPPPLFTPPADLVLLLTCSRDDALGIVQVLSGEGISFYWRDGREDEELLGEEGVALAVRAAQLERAENAVQAWMASRSPNDAEEAVTEA